MIYKNVRNICKCTYILNLKGGMPKMQAEIGSSYVVVQGGSNMTGTN
jgi:hypothetical protein